MSDTFNGMVRLINVDAQDVSTIAKKARFGNPQSLASTVFAATGRAQVLIADSQQGHIRNVSFALPRQSAHDHQNALVLIDVQDW